MKAKKQNGRIVRPLILSLPLLFCVFKMPAQAQCNGTDLSTGDGYRVRSVTVKTLFGRAPLELDQMLDRHKAESYQATEYEYTNSKGKKFFGTTTSILINEVKAFFQENTGTASQDSWVGVSQHNSMSIRATYLDTCVTIIPPATCQAALKDNSGDPVEKCVDITVNTWVIPINTSSLGSNLLDLARSNKLRFYRELPRPLTALNPTFWIEQDKVYGPMAIASTATDLIGLFNKDDTGQNKHLRFSMNGRKSLNQPFYDLASVLAFSYTRQPEVVEGVGVEAGFIANRTPKGEGTLFTNAAVVSGTLLLKFTEGPFTQLNLAGGYRRSGNRFFSQGALPNKLASEDALDTRAIIDGSIGRSFTRGAVWFEQASPDKGAESYRRFAVIAGFARDFVLPQSDCKIEEINAVDTCVIPQKNAPAIGIEALFGAGRSWGSVPEYARFYGGNSTINFLYGSPSEPSMTSLPEGPLIRSFGRNQAGVKMIADSTRGGTSYWHTNISISLPILKLSSPLIPSVVIDAQPDESGKLSCSGCTSLKQVLKNQVANGENMFIDALAVQKLTQQQRDDLALDRDDGLTAEELARLEAAERAFEQARTTVRPEADALWRKLTPTINYIADHANLYSIKPMVMFDAAGISARGEPSQRTRLALGGGLQFNVVVAKFEAGYMRTVRRLPGDSTGNFVVRLIFEKLF